LEELRVALANFDLAVLLVELLRKVLVAAPGRVKRRVAAFRKNDFAGNDQRSTGNPVGQSDKLAFRLKNKI
jgi:hypothetical protein